MTNSDALTETMRTCAETATGLLKREAYPDDVRAIKLIETHISWVFLTGRYTYKVKKPVDLGFVNFSTLALRKHFCEEEVRLNRRLAPALYLDVVAITGTPDSPRLGGTGTAIEYAVKMRQFDYQQTLDHLLNRGEANTEQLEAFATALGRFHRDLPPCQSDWHHGSVETITAAARQNFEQLEPLLKESQQLKHLEKIQRWSDTTLLTLAACMRQRKIDGWVRECHGDLHSGNIVLLQDALVAFDCLEFNRDFRWLDVISEVSFLGMDLAARNREDLAFSLFNRYLETTADYGAARLINFYRVYYCMVRAKVAALTTAQGHDSHAEVVTQPSPSDYLDLASQLMSQPKPQLLLTHGLSGSGKTWLTNRLLTRLPAIRLRADLVRKSLHGFASTSDSHSGIDSDLYSPEATRRTYQHLAQLAGQLLDAGFNTIIDAACLKAWQRQLLQATATERQLRWKIVDCYAPDALLRERVEARQAMGTDASEAGLAVLEHQIETREALTQAEKVDTVRVSIADELDVSDVVRALTQ